MQIIGLILGLAALIWIAVLIRQGGLLVGCLMVLVGGSCLGHAFLHVSILTIDRVLLAGLFAYYLIDLRMRRRSPKRFSPPDLYLALSIGALCISTFSHDWRVDEFQPASRFLFLYAMPALMYWLARESKLDTKHAIWLSKCLIGFSLYLSVTAVAEMMGWWSIVMPRYIVNNEFTEFLGRGRGPFLNPSANGIFITTGLTCLLMCWPNVSGWKRFALATGVVIMCAGSFSTLTRCVWLGTVMGFVSIVWFCFPARLRLGILTLLFCTTSLGIATNWSRLAAFKRDRDIPVSQMSESARLRPMLAAVAWKMVKDRPITGLGLGQYTHHDDKFIAARTIDMPLDRVRPYHQHNFLLSLLTETGLVGTLPFVALLISWAVSANKLWWKNGVPFEIRRLGIIYLVALVNYVTNGMFQDVTIIPMVNLLLFFLAGVVMSAALDTESCVGWPRINMTHNTESNQRHALGT